MLNIKKGDVLKWKDDKNDTRKVLAVLDDVCLLSRWDVRNVAGSWFTESEIKEYFDLPEEKWEPELTKSYCYIGETSRGEIVVYDAITCNQDFLNKKIMQNNCFPTRALAEAKLKEVLEVLKK